MKERVFRGFLIRRAHMTSDLLNTVLFLMFSGYHVQ